MTKLTLTGAALIAMWSSAYAPAIGETANGERSAVAKNAACRADCAPDGLHGLYKPYHADSWLLKTETGRKMYLECVRKCRAPLPWFYVQRPILEHGGIWFGKTAASCMDCHDKGPNLRVP